MSDDDKAHARIEGALGQLGEGLAPPVGWQARVLAAVAEPARRRPWWHFALPALAVAAAVVIAVVVLRPRPEAALELAISEPFDPSGAPEPSIPMAGGSGVRAALGKSVTVAVRGAGPHRALWVYRDERTLVVACPGGAECRATAQAVEATVRFATVGTYTFVAWAASQPIAAPAGSYDQAIVDTERSGATKRVQTITVQ